MHDGLQALQRLGCVQGASRRRCALLGARHGGGTVLVGMAAVLLMPASAKDGAVFP